VRAYLDGKLRTLAMLKCIGASNRVLFQTYLIQILVLAGGGILIGLIIGSIVPSLAARILEQLLPVPIQVGFYPAALVLAALFGLLITLSFAVWPLAQANQVPAAALFRANLEGSRQRPASPYIILTLL
ncbi:MAG: FtsX-like permease family protein, partial [Candidatus Competibacteraceae bacterium]|nr:FtsX-like permease family protein [Candidatus Competibacteraceae bacterium]